MKKSKKLSQLNDAPLNQPQNRTERFLAKIAKLADTAPADTRTRLERYLAAIVQSTAQAGIISADTETTVEGILFGNSTTGKVEGIVPEMSAENVADYLNMVADASEAGGIVDSSQLNKLFVPVSVGPASLITLDDGVDGAILGKCVVNIEPVQSGSGDPSPTNVRPISGWTGAKVNVFGTNLLDYHSNPVYISDGVNITVKPSVNGFRASCTSDGNWKQIQFPITIPMDGVYTLSADVDIVSSGIRAYVDCAFVGENEVISRSYSRDTDGKIFYTCRVKAGEYKAGFWVSGSTASNNVADFCDIMVKAGEESYPSYEPYTGNVLYSISFPSEAGTVYGGTLDVGTGVLKVTHGYLQLTNADSVYMYNNLRGVMMSDSLPQSGNRQVGICSHEANVGRFINTHCLWLGAVSRSIYWVGILDVLGISTAEEFNEWIATQTVQVAYELPTLQTYQLTSTQVRTLLGQNNIYADCGEVTIQYRGDIPNIYKLFT